MRRAFPAFGRILTAFLVAGASVSQAEAPPLSWVGSIGSPRPVAAKTVAEREIVAACPETDAALVAVAGQLASHKIAADDVEAITYALRAAGDPHVWPRAFLLEGKTIEPGDAKTRTKAWLASFPKPTRLRCGFVAQRSAANVVIAGVAFDAQADLENVAVRARTASWVDIDAKILASSSGAKVIMLGPTGAPRSLLTSFSGGRVKARANVDRPGTWLFQVLIDGATGPRPVLETYVFAGVEPFRTTPHLPAPGEDAATASDAAMAMTQMVSLARRSESLPGLVRDITLDRVAQRHADRMMRARQVGHDVGDGDPKERLERAGISLPRIGENVAHAANVVLAHRALWNSPSHRENLLQPGFDRLGVGVSSDADGSVWVAEVFASAAASPL